MYKRQTGYPAFTLVGSHVETPGIQFHDLSWSSLSEQLYTTVATSGVSDDEFLAISQAGVDEFGIRSLSLTGLLLDDDRDVEMYGLYLLALYQDPQALFTSVTVKLSDTPRLSDPQRATLLGADIGLRTTVVFQPPGGGDQVVRECVIDGVSHSRTREQWTVTFRLAPADLTDYGVYDESLYDSGARFAY